MKRRIIITSMASIIIAIAMLLGGCGSTQTKEVPVAEATTEIAVKAEEPTTEAVTTEAPATEAPAADAVNKEAANLISEEEALKICLKDAGIDKADIINERIQKEYDDGKDIYDVEFHVGQTEYNYDIDAVTGDILESESDIDDDD